MPTSERDEAPRAVPGVPTGVSMRDLLASCAAADLISRPPREPEPTVAPHRPERRQAA
ncbi:MULTISPECIES: hypothetical protein [Streptomyces]|uniref:Uncharacterized protein n=1 Tax=Streptomyces broussonetiae TaxID=2686304 RepID=A0ABV5EGB0_9ACTN|nr:hypothetical protein [Streptomyces sp. B93]MBC7272171.1 hypothetical protein [Streptomyces sp.]MBQ1090103.1 hypothetical protein [Streptomyces sp. B93]